VKKTFVIVALLGLFIISACVSTTTPKRTWMYEGSDPSWSQQTWEKDKFNCYHYARNKAIIPGTGKDIEVPAPSRSLNSTAWSMFAAVMASDPERINIDIFNAEWDSCIASKVYRLEDKASKEKEIQENEEYYRKILNQK
jgi:hypothetical protein